MNLVFHISEVGSEIRCYSSVVYCRHAIFLQQARGSGRVPVQLFLNSSNSFFGGVVVRPLAYTSKVPSSISSEVDSNPVLM